MNTYYIEKSKAITMVSLKATDINIHQRVIAKNQLREL